MTPPALIAAADVAKTYRIPIDHLYVLAHRKRWRRLRWQGRVYYYLDDVDRDLGRESA